MKYNKILKQLAAKENMSVKEIEKEMELAIVSAGLDCSVKEFIETAAKMLKERTIYSI